ncbi:MAG: ABC transporter permease [Gammaproteobacteria bacterium]|nr:ABC transporter permease [Gammaproteobacteria bacterium]MCP5136017.1 ABC transporter permease [Gammaproteobacteria bacterium]
MSGASAWQLAPLWTDYLLWLLVLAVALTIAYVRRQPHLRAPWRQVGRSGTGMVAALVLMAYVGIGLLDSVHLTSDRGAVVSVLDLCLSDLRDRTETTYSAPLATHSASLESMTDKDGNTVRAAPRLRYGGAHLGAPAQQRNADLRDRALLGIAKAVALWLAIAVVMLIWRRRLGSDGFPMRRVLGTLLVMALMIGVLREWADGYHVFGTDKVGQDVLYLSLKSVRTGLMIGLLTTLVMLPLAMVLGIAAGYFRGWVDDLIQYLYTTLSSIPSVLLIAAAVLMMQVTMSNHPEWFDSLESRADLRLLFLCVILGVTSWTGLCRLLRAETLKLREADYVEAARAAGVGPLRILSRHIAPNVMHIVLIQVTLDFSALVLAEAVLSYVGVGVDPSTPSWGNMINAARLELAREPVVWWSLSAAFAFMFTLVLAANLFADQVREAFDPRRRA